MTDIKWVTNVPNPYVVNKAWFRVYLSLDNYSYAEWMDWFESHFKGIPKASDVYTEEQLMDMDMIGLYKLESRVNNSTKEG